MPARPPTPRRRCRRKRSDCSRVCWRWLARRELACAGAVQRGNPRAPPRPGRCGASDPPPTRGLAMPPWQTLIRRLLFALVLPFGLVHAGEAETERANNAVRVLKEIMMAPDKRVPSDLLNSAFAVAVIPDVIKAGF